MKTLCYQQLPQQFNASEGSFSLSARRSVSSKDSINISLTLSLERRGTGTGSVWTTSHQHNGITGKTQPEAQSADRLLKRSTSSSNKMFMSTIWVCHTEQEPLWIWSWTREMRVRLPRLCAFECSSAHVSIQPFRSIQARLGSVERIPVNDEPVNSCEYCTSRTRMKRNVTFSAPLCVTLKLRAC